ncbi:hypothetical protein V8E36_003072 [Tilletia maclaganii]
MPYTSTSILDGPRREPLADLGTGQQLQRQASARVPHSNPASPSKRVTKRARRQAGSSLQQSSISSKADSSLAQLKDPDWAEIAALSSSSLPAAPSGSTTTADDLAAAALLQLSEERNARHGEAVMPSPGAHVNALSASSKSPQPGNRGSSNSTRKGKQLMSVEELISAARTAFRDSSFQPKGWQLQGAYMAATGWDGIVAAGTGSGKSMLWILSALMNKDANILVIAPLKAIQQEQVKKLRRMGISAVALNSDTIGRGKIRFRRTSKSSLDPIQKIHRGKAQVVFAAPETLITNAAVCKAICESAWAKKLAAIFGDEAHIIHAWGMASSSGRAPFRPAYGKLSTLRARFSCHVPMIAVSATLVGSYLPSVCSSLSYGLRPFFAMDVGKERDGCVYDVQTFQHTASSFIDLLEMLPTNPHALVHLPKMLVYVNSRVVTVARGTKLEGEGLVGRAVGEGWTGVVAKGACVLGLVDWEVTI